MDKKAFKYFNIMQYREEEEYLRSMHRSGWKLVRISGLCIYHFEQCEPQDVIYKLDYNKDGIRHKAEYVKMFNDCGWEYVQDYVGYSYFRKAADDSSGSDDIFCDDESRLQMMSRVFKGRLLPLLLMLFIVIIPQLVFGIMNGRFIIAGIFAVILILYAVMFTWFSIDYRRYKNSLKK